MSHQHAASFLVSMLMFVMLFVPCGIKIVNRVRPLWWARQTLFALLFVLNFLDAVR